MHNHKRGCEYEGLLTDGTKASGVVVLLSNKAASSPRTFYNTTQQTKQITETACGWREMLWREGEEGAYEMLSCCALCVKKNQEFPSPSLTPSLTPVRRRATTNFTSPWHNWEMFLRAELGTALLSSSNSAVARSHSRGSNAKGRTYLGGEKNDQYRGSVRGSPSRAYGLFRLYSFSWQEVPKEFDNEFRSWEERKRAKVSFTSESKLDPAVKCGLQALPHGTFWYCHSLAVTRDMSCVTETACTWRELLLGVWQHLFFNQCWYEEEDEKWRGRVWESQVLSHLQL